VLVTLRKEYGVIEMDLLRQMRAASYPGVSFPKAAALAVTDIKSGRRQP
jgi:hypothetical protein